MSEYRYGLEVKIAGGTESLKRTEILANDSLVMGRRHSYKLQRSRISLVFQQCCNIRGNRSAGFLPELV